MAHSGSFQWNAIIGGVTIAVYAKKIAVIDIHAIPKIESGYMSLHAQPCKGR
jgi:hypothetical protein